MSASPATPRESTPSTSSATATATSAGPFASARKVAPPPPKPVNVFSSDGSFLERFKKQSEEASKDKQKQEEALARKKAADNRFKNRGKRPAAVTATSEDGSAPKKKKEGEALSEYQKEVARLSARSLQDEGAGMRPLMK